MTDRTDCDSHFRRDRRPRPAQADPSLYSNFIKGRLPGRLHIVGVGRREWTDETLIDHAHQSLKNYATAIYDERAWERFRETLTYSKVNLPQPETYQTLRDDLDALDGGCCNRLYYLSIAPEFYADVVCNLGALDMARENGGGRVDVAPSGGGSSSKSPSATT